MKNRVNQVNFVVIMFAMFVPLLWKPVFVKKPETVCPASRGPSIFLDLGRSKGLCGEG